MSETMFNPSRPEYKKVKDLPKEEQRHFANEEGGGFVRKEAKEEFDDAKKTDSDRIGGLITYGLNQWS